MGGGGGGMMKTFQRAVRAGVGGAPPNSSTNIGGAKADKAKNFNSKRPTSPNTALTLSPYSSAPFSPLINIPTICSDESEWECVDGIEDETAARGFYENYVFRTVPSRDEVHHAVSALQQALGCSANEKVGEVASEDFADEVANSICDDDDDKMISLAGSEMDWVEHPRPRSDMAYNAFHLLETEPGVQRMVVSLSSDKAVWDAVMNNEVVKELRGSIHRVGRLVGERSNEDSDGSKGDESILDWIVMFAKAKMMQLLDKIKELMNNGDQERKGGDGLDERVKSSFFLSIVVLIIVLLARAKTNNA